MQPNGAEIVGEMADRGATVLFTFGLENLRGTHVQCYWREYR